jgi:hypothetical protein
LKSVNGVKLCQGKANVLNEMKNLNPYSDYLNDIDHRVKRKRRAPGKLLSFTKPKT